MRMLIDKVTSEGSTVEMGSAEAKPIMAWVSRTITRRNIGEVEDVLVMVTLVMVRLVMEANDVGKIR